MPKSFVYSHYPQAHSRRNEISAFELAETTMMKRLFHEGWHQYLRAHISWPPQWLNEGLAEYFEECKITDGKSLLFKTNRDQLRILRAGVYGFDRDTSDLSSRYKRYRKHTLDALLKLTKAQWMQDENFNYAFSWGVCHFLLRGPVSGRQHFQNALRSMKPNARRLENTQLVSSEIEKFLPKGKSQNDFMVFVKQLKVPGSVHLSAGRKAEKDKRYAVAIEHYTQACKVDNDNALYWNRLGFVLLRDLKYEKAITALERAYELAPEDTSIIKLLVMCYGIKKRWEDVIRITAAGMKLPATPRFLTDMAKRKIVAETKLEMNP